MNLLYFIIAFVIFSVILDVVLEIWDLEDLAFCLSSQVLSILLNLAIMLDLAFLRAWFILKIEPPDPFPEDYKTLNTIVGLILFLIFFIGIPFFILGLDLTIIIDFFLIIWLVYSPFISFWTNLDVTYDVPTQPHINPLTG